MIIVTKVIIYLCYLWNGVCMYVVAEDDSCSVDGLPYLHAACSGRPACEYQVADRALDAALPCFRTKRPFLRVQYDCVTGEEAARSWVMGTFCTSVTGGWIFFILANS